MDSQLQSVSEQWFSCPPSRDLISHRMICCGGSEAPASTDGIKTVIVVQEPIVLLPQWLILASRLVFECQSPAQE